MRKFAVSALVLSLVFVLSAFTGFAADPPAEPKPKPLEVGDPVADFSLPGLDGKNLSFGKDIKGKHDVTIFAFMTTACSACQAEISALSQVVEKFKGKVGLYAVAVDIRGAEPVKQYAEGYKYNATYLLDPKFTTPRLYGFGSTPSIVIADKGGVVVFKNSGYSPNDDDLLVEKVTTLLKK